MTNRRSPAWRLFILMIGAIALLGLAAAAACGDDDDGGNGDGDGNGDPTATLDDGDGDGDDDGDDDDGGGNGNGDGDGDGDGGGDLLSDLEDFASDYETATGVVTYTFTSGDGETGIWTIYSDGDNSRVDMEFDDGGFITINTPDATYTCTESDGEGFCFGGDNAGGGVNPFAGFFTSFASSSAILSYVDAFTDVNVDTSSEIIAGVDADCQTVSGELVNDEGTIQWCWSDSGLLLLAEYDLTEYFEMRATEFSDDVPADAFEPPYDVQSIG